MVDETSNLASDSLGAATGADVRLRVAASRRVVIKIGSQVLCQRNGALDEGVFARLCSDLRALLGRSYEVIVVSSGAVALGRAATGQGAGAADSGTGALGKQALAAVGQGLLMSRYRERLAAAGIEVAQILLTHSDLANRQRFIHARQVLAELVAAGIVPIVNENDTVAVDELKFGDNDQLAAQVAFLCGADALVLLTEVAGLFTADPTLHPAAQLIATVDCHDDTALQVAGDGTSQLGTGGMHSKVLAARRAGELGVPTIVASGKRPGVLQAIFAGTNEGTVFVPAARAMTARRKWIFSSARPRGSVLIDAGACDALLARGSSLLAVGVCAVEGRFRVGDAVWIRDGQGAILGRGMVRYDSAGLRRVAGLQTEQIAPRLGWLPAREVIHRDDFVSE